MSEPVLHRVLDFVAVKDDATGDICRLWFDCSRSLFVYSINQEPGAVDAEPVPTDLVFGDPNQVARELLRRHAVDRHHRANASEH